MKKTPLFSLALLSLTILGCSATGGEFSCKANAVDSCLTIEQVDAMTRFADGAALAKQDREQPLWIAPALSNKKTKV